VAGNSRRGSSSTNAKGTSLSALLRSSPAQEGLLSARGTDDSPAASGPGPEAGGPPHPVSPPGFGGLLPKGAYWWKITLGLGFDDKLLHVFYTKSNRMDSLKIGYNISASNSYL
jgi:hypothetical protein